MTGSKSDFLVIWSHVSDQTLSVFIQGDLVYVNYATVDDFRRITEQMNLSVTAKICIARRGRIHTSSKVKKIS